MDWGKQSEHELRLLTIFLLAILHAYCLHVVFSQHLGGAFVELFSAPHFLEARQQVVATQPPLFGTLEVVDDLAAS